MHKRNLPLQVEQNRLYEIEEHIKEYKNNKNLQMQFDYVFINDYTDKSKYALLQIIEKKIENKAYKTLSI